MKIERDVHLRACEYLEALDSPVSLSVKMLMEAGEWEQLAVKRVDPRTYEARSYGKFRRDYSATELLRKFPDLPISVDRKKVAIEKFWESERECARANVRLDPYIHDRASEDCVPEISDYWDKVRRVVYRIIGGYPPDTIDLRYGPGATFESRLLAVSRATKPNLTIGDKFQQFVSTPSASCYHSLVYSSAAGRALVRAYPYQSGPQFVRGNRFFTVPKDATTERGACAEPGVNVQVQLGLGRALRERLKRFGLDLTTGQLRHGQMAREALSRDLVTIDLKSASDCMSKKLVQLLLPDGWYTAVNAARSPLTLLEGKWVLLEKFSSMGNGFTFELETLLFYAMCLACADYSDWADISVFGDDIIVPRSIARAVIAILAYAGFTTNARKTFTTGEFRESCGVDTFAGRDVRVFRWDSSPSGPLAWIAVHNGMWRAIGDIPQSQRPLSRVVSRIPVDLRLYGPEEYGDAVLHATDWRSRARMWTSRGILWGLGISPQGPTLDLEHFHPEMQYALALYGVSSSGVGYRESGAPSTWKRVKLSFS